MRLSFRFCGYVLIILILPACTGNISTSEITIDGSSTVFPISDAVAELYKTREKAVPVELSFSGTGGGFRKFCTGKIDINGASRRINDEEVMECAANDVGYVEVKIAYDGIAIVANRRNSFLADITLAELRRIWEPAAEGQILKWNQIRPEWPDEDIHLYGPGPASGTYDYFSEVVVGHTRESRGDFTASEDDNILAGSIGADRHALGFFGLAYYEENKDHLKLVAIRNDSASVIPTPETVLNGTYTPFSRPVFLYIRKESLDRPEVMAFTRYYLDNARQMAEQVGYIPLSEKEYQAEKRKLDEL